MDIKETLSAEQQARRNAANKIINEYPHVPHAVHDVITSLVAKAATLEEGRKLAESVAIEITRAREAAAPHYRAALREVMK